MGNRGLAGECRLWRTAIIALIIMPVLFNGFANADTITADSCSYEDVSSAIDSAESGDTVIVPAGECVWDETVSIPDNKRIILQGTGSDATVITWEGTNEAIDLGRSGSRLTGFKVILPSGTSNYCVHVYGNDWRIDHCEFENFTGNSRMGIYIRGIPLYSDPRGLVDNCVFKNTRVNIHGDASLTAHNSWYINYQLGTRDFVFVEDCIFTRTIFGNSIDVQYGGNYVFRQNVIINSNTEVHSSDNSDGSHRAGRLWEIYENTFNATKYMYAPFRLRGGTGVVYSNTIKGDYEDPNILIDNVRTYEGYCTEYPCRDQIGRGRDAWLWTDEHPFHPRH